MSWAMRRRVLYIVGLVLFFSVVFGVPIAIALLSVPPSCVDGEQNQSETAPDKGGPCPNVDTNALAPSSVVWTRSFKVRNGSYSATSYIQNPNDHAGIANIGYIFSLYDSKNILIAERRGSTFVMPGGVTPVYEPDIDTGNRIAARAFFKFTTQGVWRRYDDMSKAILVSDRQLTDPTTAPRLEATAINNDVSDRTDVTFVAVIFDTAGNAFASSATKVEHLLPGEPTQIVFTWPDPFLLQVGRVDIIPVVQPKRAWSAPCVILNDQIQCESK